MSSPNTHGSFAHGPCCCVLVILSLKKSTLLNGLFSLAEVPLTLDGAAQYKQRTVEVKRVGGGDQPAGDDGDAASDAQLLQRKSDEKMQQSPALLCIWELGDWRWTSVSMYTSISVCDPSHLR